MGELHVLIITADGDDEYDRDYRIECPGITEACQMWRECTDPTCQPWSAENPTGYTDHTAWDDAMYGSGEAHGVEHRPFSFGWCVPAAGQCFIRDNDHLPDSASDLNLPPGRYPVSFQVDDEEYFSLFPAEAASNG